MYCISLPNVDAYITECFTEVQISRTTSERLIQKQLLSVVSWENPPVLSPVKLNNHTVSQMKFHSIFIKGEKV